MIQAGRTLAARRFRLLLPLPFYSPASTGARGWSQSLAIGRACGPLVIKPGLALSWHSKGTNPNKEKFRPGRWLLLALVIITCLFKGWMRGGSKNRMTSFTNTGDNQCGWSQNQV